jgi:hypothetical protein
MITNLVMCFAVFAQHLAEPFVETSTVVDTALALAVFLDYVLDPYTVVA